MKSKPLISYVITTYNIEKYVREAVECAFAQTYSPLEIVLSDDCSSDGTFAIMQQMANEYKGPHKIVLNRNENNMGITRHMNKAYIELANGEIIIAAHGDDISKPERTALSWSYLSTHPNITALSFAVDAISEEGKLLPRHSSSVDSVHFYTLMGGGGNIPAPSRAFYKRVMTTFGPLNDDCPTEDELITFRALMLGRNAFFPEHMVQYRKHSGSSSNPENFARFPLDMILKQMDDDMEKGIAMGLLTRKQRDELHTRRERGHTIRKLYRKYYASRKLKDLWTLMHCPLVSRRSQLHYIREHLYWLLHKE